MKESAALLGIVADALARIGGAVAAHPRSATEARIMADCDIPPPVTPQEAEWRAAWQRADAALREVIVERDRLLAEAKEAQRFADPWPWRNVATELGEKLSTAQSELAAMKKERDHWRNRCTELTNAFDAAIADRDHWQQRARDREAVARADAEAATGERPWQPGDVLLYEDAGCTRTPLGSFIVRYGAAVDDDPGNFMGTVVNPGLSGWVKGQEYLFSRQCFVRIEPDQDTKPTHQGRP